MTKCDSRAVGTVWRKRLDRVGVLGVLGVILWLSACSNEMNTKRSMEEEMFALSDADRWEEVFFDSGKEDWSERWFLDGEVGTVTNGPEGMTLTAGPEAGNDAHHMVLWTKESFEGDLRIEYNYTRLDDATKFVNILYIQATGSGEEPYVEDIAEWSELRKVPAMSTYFDKMNLYHISYAAFPNDENVEQYIRARRYMPHATGLSGSDLEPDYFPETLFAKGVPHEITVIKRDQEILMRIQNPDETYFCRMINSELPPILEGRVGLRHMYTRSARYENIRISALQDE